MNSIDTQTPLLRFFITYYSFIGTQYSLPSDWTNLGSLLRLLWNSTITSVVIYGLIWHDPFRMLVVFQLPCVDNPLYQRPLFSTFASVSFSYAYPFVYLLYPLFGMFYGRRILRQLDCVHFRRFYHSKKQAVVLFSAVLGVSHLSLVTVLLERHQIHRRPLDHWPTTTELIELTALYVVFQYIFWLLHLLHYYQWATYRILLGLKEKARKKTITEAEVLATVRSLATVNAALNRLLSPLIIIYVLFLVFNFIFIACLMTMCTPGIRNYMHLFTLTVYAYYISLLNGAVQRTVAEILARLLTGLAKEKCQIVLKRKDKKPEVEHLLLQRVDSRRVDVLECDRLYRGHFSVHVYQMTVVDIRFLFSTALFIVAYSVFIMQTSH